MIYWLPLIKQPGSATEASYDLYFGSRMGTVEQFTYANPGFTGARTFDPTCALEMKPISATTDSYIVSGTLILEIYNCDKTCNSITVSNIKW